MNRHEEAKTRAPIQPVATGVTLLCSALVGILAPGGAIAQERRAEPGVLEEVIVSARRRGDEKLQDIPIAVSVLSAEDLFKSGINDFFAVAQRAPSVTLQEQIGNQQELVIRGIGTLRLTGSAAEPSVGTFIDEVYIGRRGAATPPIFDLERVEVVRGPQGTLYGKNIVGGAINLVTGRPSHDFSGMASINYGEFDGTHGQDQRGLEAYVTNSLTPDLAGRMAVYARDSGGYSRNVLLNSDLDDNTTYAARGSLLFTPSSNLTVHLTAEYADSEGGGQSRRAIDDPTVADPGAVSGSGMLPEDLRASASPWTQWDDREIYGLTGRVDYTFESGRTLTYLAAVRDGDYEGRYSLIGATSPPSLTDAANGQVEQYTGITQDLRLSSALDAGGISWIAGLYYLREKTVVRDRSIATSFLSILGPGSIGDILDGELFYDQENLTQSYAVYGEINWDISDTLVLTLGGRYTWDEKEYQNRSECLDFGAQDDFIFCVAPLGAEFWDFEIEEGWSEFTPKLGLEWRTTDDALLYASAAKGFKGGGWQGKPGTQAAAVRSYDPETAWTYELGAKTEWLERRVMLNVALFYTDFEDLQVEQLDDVGLTLIIDNAATAEIRGIELETILAPTPNFRLWLNGSWIDSEYQDFVDSAGNDLSGNTLARTPEYMLSIGADYTVPLSERWSLDGRVEYNWQDEMPWLVENTIFEGSYGLLDATIGLVGDDGQLRFEVFGRNLTDELYAVDQIPFLGDSFARFGQPRSYGIRLTKRF